MYCPKAVIPQLCRRIGEGITRGEAIFFHKKDASPIADRASRFSIHYRYLTLFDLRRQAVGTA